jgi:hypothetical protein
MMIVAVSLIFVSVISLVLSFFWARARALLLIVTFFALLNSFFSAPLNWMSFVQGSGFRLSAISPSDPPIELHKLALPTDSPEKIILKMGCHVCHKIPHIPQSRRSDFGPVLISGTTAARWMATEEYQERVRAGKANATTPREYVIESILDPDAFIVPGFTDPKDPEISPMYPHYAKRFTPGALEKLADYLLTLEVRAAVEDGLILAH